jgi:hypothetical protein
MQDGWQITHRSGGLSAEHALAEIVEAQHEIAARVQLLERGVSARTIDRWLRDRRVRRVHAGVYTVGTFPLSPLSRCMAAALAGGSGAGIGFAAAAWLLDMAETLPQTIDVHAPTHRTSRPGLRFHRGLPPDELTLHELIPVTIPARTILDLSPITEPHRLERMIERGEEAGLASTLTLAALLDRYPRRPGTPVIRRLLGLRDEHGSRRTRSDPEGALLHLCDHHGIPRPLTSYLLEVAGRTFELDAYWPEQRLALEYDSFEFHGGRASFRDDRIRDRILATIGVRTVRATSFDLSGGANALAADLKLLLGLR